ncbi:MAG: hypothetical protein IJW20_06050 [Clostridia bacterium]|nr:hypothetical protein [Clostridia bacterium]
MKSESGKIGIIIGVIVLILLLAVASFIIFKDSFINGPTVVNEDKGAEQLVDENTLGEGVNKLDNGVYFKNFTAADVEGVVKDSKKGKRYYAEYIDTGKGSGYYYKLINTYQEYLDFKAKQPDIIEMSEEYFNEYFMIVTAPYSTSYIGTGLDRIDAFENTLYISFKYTGDSEDKEFIENSTKYKEEVKQLVAKYEENECVSFMIPNTMKKEEIQIFTNLINEEKDFSSEVKIAYKDDYEGYSKEKKDRSEVGFKYFDETSRQLLIENMQGNNAITQQNYNYKNSIAENITITKDMPEIDFSTWENLGNDYYALRLTDYSEYKKLIDYYGVRKLTNSDFECIFATIIVRANTENSFSADEVTVDENGINLKITTDGALEADENLKYPAMLVYTPNYMNLTDSNLKISEDK